MCLSVYLGTFAPVTGGAAEDGAPWECAEVAADAPIRAHFTTPHVTYVGAYEGCGCGFNSAMLASEGFERVADVAPLVAAMDADDRTAWRGEEASRAQLHARVVEGLQAGAVEIHACWIGDEAKAVSRVEAAEGAAWIVDRLVPLDAGTRVTIAADRSPT